MGTTCALGTTCLAIRNLGILAMSAIVIALAIYWSTRRS